MKSVLVLCTGNSCRSQMAHGYLQKMAGTAAKVVSAGIEKHGVNPKAILVMKEDGVDISHHTSNTIEEYDDQQFDLILTVCDNAKEQCPYFPSQSQRFHHNFTDPSHVQGTEAEVLQAFRHTRDEIKEFCATFASSHLVDQP